MTDTDRLELERIMTDIEEAYGETDQQIAWLLHQHHAALQVIQAAQRYRDATQQDAEWDNEPQHTERLAATEALDEALSDFDQQENT